MLGLYTSKDVQKLVRRLREEYGAVLEKQKEAAMELKAQNRILLARVSQLETERDSVSDAIVHAVAEGERIKRESAMEAENERKELVLLAEKCRLMTDKLGKPDTGDAEAYSAFLHRLHDALENAPEGAAETALGSEPESAVEGDPENASNADAFDMDEVLAPKEPLNLEKLCMDLGLMGEDNE